MEQQVQAGEPGWTATISPVRGDRRMQVLLAADELLAEHGLEGLTIRAVLARTGLARRAFYDLFATKDDLVLAVFEATLADAAAQLEELGKALAGPFARLDLIVRTIVVAGASDTGRTRERPDRRGEAFSLEHLRLAQARPDDLQRAIAPLIELIERVIAEGIAAGDWHSPDAERSAKFVYNLVSTTVQTELLDPQRGRASLAAREQLADQLLAFCAGALAR